MAKSANELPHNIDAEKAVLGSALISNDAALSVLASLDEEDFYLGKHQLIYRAMNYLKNEQHTVIDTVSITDQLIIMKEYENIGGVDYLKECSDAMVSLGALDFYIHSVKDNAILRKMLLTIRGIDKDFLTKDIKNINEFISNSEDAFKNSIEQRRISDFMAVKDIAPRVDAEIQVSNATGDTLTGITTGYKELDRITQGLRRSEVTILAARPSVGKTSFALNVAFRAATRAKVPVGIFSLEMSSELLFKRLISFESGVPLTKVNANRVTDDERLKVASAINKISQASIYIDDTPQAKINDIMQKCRRLQQKEPTLGLIVIDYIGLINVASNGKTEDARHNEVRKISAALKGLAMELKIPILVLCQISRSAEQRENKKPMLSDLRDSGSIEQDADMVWLMYRGDYYGQEGEKKKSSNFTNEYQKKKEIDKEVALSIPGNASYVELNVAKNRNGQVGEVGLFFVKKYCRFDEPTGDWREAYDKLKGNSIS
ncbi:MAG: replicative DNA helicase [Bacilli bacterium]|nr:replicative DNA helicase [Bacilli bacterium]